MSVPGPQAPAITQTPVRPRDAASLVILRGHGASCEVLLGRREPRDRFMPDIYVFPGGRVDPGDASHPAKSELGPGVIERLRTAQCRAKGRALAVAAVRETYEETGLAFGDLEAGRILPSLDILSYIARAITPAGSHIRYHARFFLARAEHAVGSLRSNGELLDLRFVPLAEVKDLAVMDVTKYVLQEAARCADGLPDDRVRKISYVRDLPRVRYE
jgi:8-oxo-dGTP pyrophosphatase MutT (NUDIX family)